MSEETNPNKTYKRLKEANNVIDTVIIQTKYSSVEYSVIKNDDGSLSLADPDTNKPIINYDNMEQFVKNLGGLDVTWNNTTGDPI